MVGQIQGEERPQHSSDLRSHSGTNTAGPSQDTDRQRDATGATAPAAPADGQAGRLAGAVAAGWWETGAGYQRVRGPSFHLPLRKNNNSFKQKISPASHISSDPDYPRVDTDTETFV